LIVAGGKPAADTGVFAAATFDRALEGGDGTFIIA
jgi:hypothetical protein